MAARKRRTGPLSEQWRAKIRTGVLLDRLEKHALGNLKMSQSQIKAAEVLLKKTLSDAPKIVEGSLHHTGNVTITLGFGEDDA